MIHDAKTAADAGAAIGIVVTPIAQAAGQITPILSAISLLMAIGWFCLRFYHYFRHGRDIPSD